MVSQLDFANAKEKAKNIVEEMAGLEMVQDIKNAHISNLIINNMKFVQTLKYLKQGFKARRKSWEDLLWIALGNTKEDDEGEFDETILDNSELTPVTFFLINLHDGIEAFCPYLQDIEADDWMIMED